LEVFTDDWSRLETDNRQRRLASKTKELSLPGPGFMVSAGQSHLWSHHRADNVPHSQRLPTVIPWLWFALLVLPLAAWFFEDNRQEYERALVSLVG
jgi:hypothetical protein